MRLLFLDQWADAEIVRVVCWTLVHSLWQGLLAATGAGLILLFTKKSSAALRYNLLTALLALFVFAAVVTFIRETQQTYKGNTKVSFTASGHSIVSVTEPATARSASPGPTLSALTTFFNTHAASIVFIWALFFLGHVIKLLAGLRYVHSLRCRQLSSPPEEWKNKLREFSRQLGIRQKVMFLQSGLVKVPVVVGFLKPLVLVPVGLLYNLPPTYVESILLHELAHVRRKDFAVNVLQSVVEMIFFFNPTLLWLSSLIRQEREACCDDVVLAHTGEKADYLCALVAFQEKAFPDTPALAIAGKQTYLLNRVKRMLTHENKSLNIMEKTILFFGLMLFSAFALVPKKDLISKVSPAVTDSLVPTVIYRPAQTEATVVSARSVTNATSVRKTETAKTKMEKEPVVVAAVAQRDTVPEKKQGKQKISNVTRNTNDDGTTKTVDVIATTEDGTTTYVIKKVNGVITEFTVNGKSLSKEEREEHRHILDELDQREKQAEQKSALAKQKRVEQQELAKAQKAELRAQRAQSDKQKAVEKQWEKTQEAQQEKEERLAEKEKGAWKEKEALKEKGKVQPAKPAKGEKTKTNTNNEIQGIVNDLVKENVIASTDAVSFTLTDHELIVNGSRQNAELHQRLKEKYGIKGGDLLQYRKEGGTTQININRN
ncbi:MAG: hypothetical protein ICV84_09985 [Flavisolibacter sp.]|nr:hypothetical protein [Flavisolibacter sp.]